ncbi:MAG: hypothetical protein H6565_14950 [Lewinellaceae bacterium]|nr:hypothetical protein [Lewinellaceae bacterium]MCB9356353.1 hypothetical protein [Lewinellaceae bacterium]
MKKRLIFLFACAAMLASPVFLNASAAVAPQEMRAGFMEKINADPEAFLAQDKKMAKRLNRIAKRVERKMARKAKRGEQVDFSDPVDQWLWFGVFGLGIAILLSFFALGVGGLIAFLAIVCLVIWVIKRGSV